MEFRTLYANEIECRVKTISSKGLSLLLYKDARVDQKLLDEVVGSMNWQRHHSRDNANCIVAIWDESKKAWVEKEDTGTESNTEASKGLASDSFKRACFNWGIGRELYTAPKFIWIDADDAEIKQENGKWTTKKRFEVSYINYDNDRNICALAIRDAKTKKVVYTYGKPAAEPARDNKPKEAPKAEPKPTAEPEEVARVASAKIDATKVAALTTALANNKVSIETIFKLYKVPSLADLTENQFANINAHWEQLKAL